MASSILGPVVVAVVTCALPACTVELADTAGKLDADPVVGCPVVDANAIAGHEATFYRCAEATLSCVWWRSNSHSSGISVASMCPP